MERQAKWDSTLEGAIISTSARVESHSLAQSTGYFEKGSEGTFAGLNHRIARYVDLGVPNSRM